MPSDGLSEGEYAELARGALGAEVANFVPFINGLVENLTGQSYRFMHMDEFQRLATQGLGPVARILWREILYRAHWGAASSLVRSHRWLHGIIQAYGQGNLMAYAACSRGFLEAAADTSYSLLNVPNTLAEHFLEINETVLGRATRLLECKELEDHLIHLGHATKPRRGEVLPESHVAELSTTYLACIGSAAPGVKAWYAWLCDVVHPGAASIQAFSTNAESRLETIVRLTPDREREAIARSREEHGEAMQAAIEVGVNSCVITLKTLNLFSLPGVHTTALDGVSYLDNSVGWQRVKQYLNAGRADEGRA